ncbi:hypothetical protein [Pontiella sulfatireligans]|uniref:Uncharacterized protein n=1 Tax=Pontiella sulfatireligans TaxID=2750658 RepID=A0A6C2UUH3_9BACT|nr:hypothetical protein [Pontiella sulfatireligans]VGO23001.1 hypothetical protein SCARR_05100 [Pontiella sulfatireligans]
MNEKSILEKTEEARKCLKQAVHDELVKKARLGLDVIIERDGKPYKISAAEALRIQEESPEYKVK